MLYKYFLVIVCGYSFLLHFLRLLGLFIPGKLFSHRLISRSPDGWDLILYYLAVMVILIQVIFSELEIGF